MTIEEEMWEAVEKEHGVLSRRESFVTLTAMEWADKTIIKKACEWLKHQEEMIGVSFEEDFIERFKKAMEDEV